MRKTKRFLSLLTTTALIASLCICPYTKQTAQAAAKAKVTKVSITNLPTNNLTLKKKKKFTLKVKVSTTGKASKAVTFKSSNKKIVKVTSKGRLTAKKNGKATITITSKANKKKKAKIKVIVGTPVKAVTLSDTKLTLHTGEKKHLSATITPANASNRQLVWSSSNSKIVSVSGGNITALSAGTATITALAADGSGKKATTQITVTAGPSVSAISLNSTKKTIKVGTTDTLIATVTPANAANKKLTWTTSNAKVASVDANGTVKGLTVGEATITATAADGSGKKASCKYTVQKPITVTGSTFLSSTTMHVTLSEPCQLKQKDFSAMVKKLETSKYTQSYPILEIHTPDHQNYFITFCHQLDDGQYLKLTITGLRGNPTCSFESIVKASPDTEHPLSSYYMLTTRPNDTVSEYYNLYGCGYSTVTFSGLPDGVTYETIPYYDHITLKLTAFHIKAGTYPYTIRYTDELGANHIIHAQIVSYDSNSLVAYTPNQLSASNPFNEVYLGGVINNSTTLSIVGENYGLTLQQSSEENNTFKLMGDCSMTKPGNYPITFRAETILGDQTLTYEYKTFINVPNTVKFSGTITDLHQQPVFDAYICVVNLSNNYPFRNTVSSCYTKTDGTYDLTLPAGEYYIYVAHPLTKIYSNTNYKLDTSKMQNFTANLYTLPLSDNDGPTIFYDENGQYTLKNEYTIVVQPGQHTYTGFDYCDMNGIHANRYTIADNFADKSTVAVVKTEQNVQLMQPDMQLDQTQNVLLNDCITTLFKFTPDSDGTYYFYSSGNSYAKDTYGMLFDEDFELLASNNNHESYKDFLVQVNLKKGVTYYLGAKEYFKENLWATDCDYISRNKQNTTALTISKTKPDFTFNKKYYQD